MRLTLAFLLLASPACAWDFVPRPVCTVLNDHAASAIDVTMTFDPSGPEYSIALTRDSAWPLGPVFSLQFDGPRSLTISTHRHRLSNDGRTLTVTDRGFGNVLDGLQFNDQATALIGGIGLPFALDGAAPAVEAFRNCGQTLTG